MFMNRATKSDSLGFFEKTSTLLTRGVMFLVYVEDVITFERIVFTVFKTYTRDIHVYRVLGRSTFQFQERNRLTE